MQDGKICTLAAILGITAIECCLILTRQDGTVLVVVVGIIAGLGGLVLPSPLKKKEQEPGEKNG